MLKHAYPSFNLNWYAQTCLFQVLTCYEHVHACFFKIKFAMSMTKHVYSSSNLYDHVQTCLCKDTQDRAELEQSYYIKDWVYG